MPISIEPTLPPEPYEVILGPPPMAEPDAPVVPVRAFMTLDEVATRLVDALQSITAGGYIVVTRVDFRSKAEPFQLTPNGQDPVDIAAGKLLQIINSAVNTAGGFYITADSRAVPRPAVRRPAKFVVPQYHPPGERRYWERVATENQ